MPDGLPGEGTWQPIGQGGPAVPPPAVPPASPPYGYGHGSGGAGPVPVFQYGQVWPPYPQQVNGMAIAALCCGLGALLLWGVPALLAVIFGHVALHQIRTSGQAGRPQGGRGMAIAGLVLGYIGLAFLTVALLVLLGSIGSGIASG